MNFTPKLTLDGGLSLPEMTKKLISDLSKLEPFSNQNPQPLFIIHNVRLQKKPQLLKDAQVKCSISADGIIKPVIFFNRPDLYALLNAQGDKAFHIAGIVTQNEWMGNTTIELQGLDVACEHD